MKVLVAWLCLTLCDPVDCSPPGFSVHGILQVRILEWLAIPFSRGSSWPRDWSHISCISGRFFTVRPTKEVPYSIYSCKIFAVFSVLYHISVWLIYFIHSRLYLLILCPYLTSPPFPLPKKNFIFNILHWLPDWALIWKLAYHMMSSVIPFNIGTSYILKNKWWTSFFFFSTLLKINIIPEGPGDWQFFAYGGSELKLS